MPKALWSYKITFSGIAPPNWNWLWQNFTLGRRVTWHDIVQTFGALCPTGAKWRPKNCILQTFCQQNNASFHPLPGEPFLWNSVLVNFLEQNFEIFSKTRHLPRKTSFYFFTAGSAFGHVCLCVSVCLLCSNFWKNWPRNIIFHTHTHFDWQATLLM